MRAKIRAYFCSVIISIDYMKGKKTGGRVAGTPNKNNPIKQVLREHSVDYFTRNIPPEDVDCFHDEEKKAAFVERNQGKLFSQYDIDIMCMKPSDRANAELNLLNYHTPKMQATAVDLAVNETNISLRTKVQMIAEGREDELINDEE